VANCTDEITGENVLKNLKNYNWMLPGPSFVLALCYNLIIAIQFELFVCSFF